MPSINTVYVFRKGSRVSTVFGGVRKKMQLFTATSIVSYPFYAQIVKLHLSFSFPFIMILFTIQTAVFR